MHPLIVLLGLAGLGLALSSPTKRSSSRAPRTRRADPGWLETERATCATLGLQHHGGPGKPDCGKSVEVKDWGRPVDAYTVKREAAKGRKTIVAPGGFTVGARDQAKGLGVKLRRK